MPLGPADWMRWLVQDLAAPLYARLIAEATKHLGPTSAYYDLWPTTEPPQPWGALVKAFYEQASCSGLLVLAFHAAMQGTSQPSNFQR